MRDIVDVRNLHENSDVGLAWLWWRLPHQVLAIFDVEAIERTSEEHVVLKRINLDGLTLDHDFNLFTARTFLCPAGTASRDDEA